MAFFLTDNQAVDFKFGDIPIRTSGEPDSVLFCVGDVCVALEIKSPSQAVERLEQVDIVQIGAEKGSQRISYNGPSANIYVTESGLYDLILGANKGREFRRWVTTDVLPTIRKTGQYSVKPMTQAELIAAQANMLVAVERAQAENERRLTAIEADRKRAASELDALSLLPPATVEASEITLGQLTHEVVNRFAVAHNNDFIGTYRTFYSAVESRPETRIDLRTRLKNAKEKRGRGEKAPRLSDIIDASNLSPEIYAIARQLFVSRSSK